MKKKKTPKAEKSWDQRREEFVRNQLRLVSIKWPAGQEAKKAARTVRKINPLTNRLAWHAKCAGCGIEFLEGMLVLDHKVPVVPVERDYSVSAYSPGQLGARIIGMFPAPEGFQMLCYGCHSLKTEAENGARLLRVEQFLAENEDLMRDLAAQEEMDKKS